MSSLELYLACQEAGFENVLIYKQIPSGADFLAATAPGDVEAGDMEFKSDKYTLWKEIIVAAGKDRDVLVDVINSTPYEKEHVFTSWL
jgi:hypothetical protein